MGVDAPTGRSTFYVWLIEKHYKAEDFGDYVKGLAVQTNAQQ